MTRPEYCELLAGQWRTYASPFAENLKKKYAQGGEGFTREHWHRGIDKWAQWYPREALLETMPSIPAWRIDVYAWHGQVARAYPFTNRITITPQGTLTHIREPDDSVRPLSREWAATCSHLCYPIPHPVCGCGIYAAPSPALLAGEIEQVVKNDRWFRSPDTDGWLWDSSTDTYEYRPEAGNPRDWLIAYPIELSDAVIVEPLSDPLKAFRGSFRAAGVESAEELAAAVAEYDGRSVAKGGYARITGTVLSTHPLVADDLRDRGFDAEQVADTAADLADHLRSLEAPTPTSSPGTSVSGVTEEAEQS